MQQRRLMYPDAKVGMLCDATRDTDGSLIVWLQAADETAPPRYRVSGETACALVQRVIFALSRHDESGTISVELRPDQQVGVIVGRQPGTVRLLVGLGKSSMVLELPKPAVQALAAELAALNPTQG